MPINPHALDKRDPRFVDQHWLLDHDMFPEQRGRLMPIDPHAPYRNPR